MHINHARKAVAEVNLSRARPDVFSLAVCISRYAVLLNPNIRLIHNRMIACGVARRCTPINGTYMAALEVHA